MARLRVSAPISVNATPKGIAKLLGVPKGKVLDWGNGYAIIDASLDDSEPEEVEEVVEDVELPEEPQEEE